MKLLQSMLFSILMGVAVAAHAVSDEVKVDLLMAKITSALKADRAADALPFFAELEGMEPSLQSPLPESFHFYYIDTLDKTRNIIKAHSRADVYLNKYGKNGKYYGQVIEIMSRLQEDVDKENERQRQKVAAEQERQREQVKADQAKQKQKTEWANKEPVFQGGLTWMPTTFYKTWEEANSDCATTAIKGQSGWRLPTKDELIALYKSGAMNGQGWRLDSTWSSTPGGSGSHYFVGLHMGGVGSGVDSNNGYVTCVR